MRPPTIARAWICLLLVGFCVSCASTPPPAPPPEVIERTVTKYRNPPPALLAPVAIPEIGVEAPTLDDVIALLIGRTEALVMCAGRIDDARAYVERTEAEN